MKPSHALLTALALAVAAACSDSSTNPAPVRTLARGVGGNSGNDTASHHSDTTGRRADSTGQHPDTSGGHHSDSTGHHPDTTGTKPPPPPPDTGVMHPAPSGIYGHVGAPVTISPDSVGIRMVAGITVVAIGFGADSAHPSAPVIAGTTTTNDGGAFSFPKVADGLYTVRAIPADGSPYLPAERQGIQVVKGAMVQGSSNQLALLIGGVWLVLTKKS